MTKKIERLEHVLAAFAADFPNDVGTLLEDWILDWSACYPQFSDLILYKAAIVLEEVPGWNRPAPTEPTPNLRDPEPSTQSLVSDDQDMVRCGFMEVGDPTPDILRAWKARYPEMADELVDLAQDLSEHAYLQVGPRREATEAQLEEGRRRGREIASMIAAGTWVPPTPLASTPKGRRRRGPALRALREEAEAKRQRRHARKDAGRRPAGAAVSR